MVRASNKTTNADNSKTINVLFLGEAGSGKTGFKNKFMNADTVIAETDESFYWDYQEAVDPIDTTHKGVNFRLNEVPGSRGRSSNYYSVNQMMQTADAVVYCQPLYYKYATVTQENIIENAQNYQRMLKSIVTSYHAKKQQKESVVPFFVIGTFADRKSEELVLDENAFKKQHLNFFQSSAVSGAGVKEAMTAILDALLNETQKGKELAAIASGQPLPTPIQKPSVYKKFLSMFGLSSHKPQPSSNLQAKKNDADTITAADVVTAAQPNSDVIAADSNPTIMAPSA